MLLLDTDASPLDVRRAADDSFACIHERPMLIDVPPEPYVTNRHRERDGCVRVGGRACACSRTYVYARVVA